MSETNAERTKKEEPTVEDFFKLIFRFSAGASALFAVSRINHTTSDVAPICVAGLAAVIWTLAEEFK